MVLAGSATGGCRHTTGGTGCARIGRCGGQGGIRRSPDALDPTGNLEDYAQSDQPDEGHQQAILCEILPVTTLNQLPEFPEQGRSTSTVVILGSKAGLKLQLLSIANQSCQSGLFL